MLLLLACTSGAIRIGEDTSETPPDTGSPPPVDSDPTETLPPNDSVDPGDDTGDEPDDDDAIYEAFFDPNVIQTIDITMTRDAINQLNAGSEEYQEGDIVVNGETFTQVGIRLKGSSTYEDLECSDGYCKAAFKIRLNEFVKGQKYGSLERITLNNMTSDYTQSKEVIVYRLLYEQSQLASRASYARVTLNGQPWGLYANVESADDEWLQRRYEDPSGNFWGTSASYGDFYQGYIDTGWVSKSGDGSQARLRELTAALDVFGGDFFGELGPYVNVDQWLDYWAWCAATGNYDGYPFRQNDVLLYEDPANEGRFDFAPWGTDETWDEYEYTGQTWNVVAGRLGYACLYDAACVAELKEHIAGALDAYEAANVAEMAQEAWDLSEEDVQTDPRRPFTPDYVWYYRDYYEGVMPGYADYVRAKVGL